MAKLKIRKRLPYYIVEQRDLVSNNKMYRLHDIFTNFCWSSTSAIEDLLHRAVLKCIKEPTMLDVYANLDKLTCSDIYKFKHRESWLRKYASKDKDSKGAKIPWDYYQEYEALLEGKGEYSDKYHTYTLYSQEYVEEAIIEYKEKTYKTSKWLSSKLKEPNKKERADKRIRDLLLAVKFSTIKEESKVQSTVDSKDISSVLNKFNRR